MCKASQQLYNLFSYFNMVLLIVKKITPDMIFLGHKIKLLSIFHPALFNSPFFMGIFFPMFDIAACL